MLKQKKYSNKILIYLLIFLTFLVFINIESSVVYSASTFGPSLIEPDNFPIAPWDRIKITFNTTELENPVQNASLFYTIIDSKEEKPNEWGSFETVEMKLEAGNNVTGTWSYELLPPHQNGTTLYYFVKVIDATGYDYCDKNSPSEAYQIKIMCESPSFEIKNFHIQEVYEKNLTCDVRFSAYIRGTYNLSDNIDFVLMSIGKSDILTVKGTGKKGEYFETFELNLQLSGDASYFPFDTPYRLPLTFWSISNENAPILYLESEKIDLVDFNDRTRWKAELSENRTVETNYLDVSVNFYRKNENIYFFIIPLLVSYFLLGGSHLLPIEKENIRNRLTINLTIFVFIIGSFSTNQIIRDMIPSIAVGSTTFETGVFSLALYSAVFVICSILSNFIFSNGRLQRWEILFDIAAVIIVLLLFFKFPIVDITILNEETSVIRTLSEHINNEWFKGLIILGLTYGVIFNIIKSIHKRLTRGNRNNVQENIPYVY